MASLLNKTFSAYNDPALLLGRILLSIMFAVGAYGKWMALNGFAGYLAKLGLPAPAILAPLTAVFETAVVIALLAGFQTRIAALAVAAFCIATALIAHMNFADGNQQIHFMKNLAIAGGALALFVAGPGAYSVDKK